tara:strand:+ start:3799 stop:5892 length:2094 start_codon:yes stop_codon:yes gene_type:complete
MLYLDLETRSQCDLIFHGLRRYCEDDSTQVICMAYCFDDEPMQFWWHFNKFPQEVIDHFDSGGLCMAQNSEFERHLFDYVISNDYNFSPPKLEQWRCSMTMALVSGYPASLNDQGRSLGLEVQKQTQGTRLIREYSVPNFLTEFKEGDEALMQDYCETDVEVMRQAVKYYRQLTEDEWAEFHLCCRINERGIPIDKNFCLAVLNYAKDISDDANRLISELTGGVMLKHTERKTRDAWLMPKLTKAQKNMLVVYKKGEEKMSLDQSHRDSLLLDETLDLDARSLLELISSAGSSALKKYAVAAHTEVDGRVHNTFQWHGAQTGRFSGRGLQPHNFRRDAYGAEEADKLVKAILRGDDIAAPATTMARLLRAMVRSEEGLYYVDWSSIEGRVAPWITRTEISLAKIALYQDNKDVYVDTASRMFNVHPDDVDKTLRQSGKIAELSLQYGGGRFALIGMAKNYGVAFTETEAQGIVDKWRQHNKWAVASWRSYDDAIKKSIKDPGGVYRCGRVDFSCDIKGSYLWVVLPSGRVLSYPKPLREMYVTPWGANKQGVTFQSSRKPAAGEPPIRSLARGALIFQNVVQGTAADILRDALVRADKAGLKIVAHVHDEIVGEGSKLDGDRLNEIMLTPPSWAEGLNFVTSGATIVRGAIWSQDVNSDGSDKSSQSETFFDEIDVGLAQLLPLSTGGVEYGKRYGK